MEIGNSKVRVITKNGEKYEIGKIKVETVFLKDPFMMSYNLMGKTLDKNEWVDLGYYFGKNEDKLFCHLKNLRRMLENYHRSGLEYVSEYKMSIFEQD